jgi:prolyl-tRNA synthetase
MAAESVFMARRDKPHKDRVSISRNEFVARIAEILDDMQKNLFEKALAFQKANTAKIDDRDAFYAYFTPKNAEQPEIHGGFAFSHWCESNECESKIKDDLRVTIRSIPFEAEPEIGFCVYCGKPSSRRVIFAKSY